MQERGENSGNMGTRWERGDSAGTRELGGYTGTRWKYGNTGEMRDRTMGTHMQMVRFNGNSSSRRVIRNKAQLISFYIS